MFIQAKTIDIAQGVTLDGVTFETYLSPEDASVRAKIEIHADSQALSRVRQAMERGSSTPVTPHAVHGTKQGKELIQALLVRGLEVRPVSFPADWDLDVEVREIWPQVDGVLKIELNGGQDPDAVAALLGCVGIRHDDS